LGLPADRLSTSIISSARYFSLSLEPGLLARLRREVSAAGQETTVKTGGEVRAAGKTEAAGTTPIRKALSMAAAAALSKGVTLHREALDEYAAAADPGRRSLSRGKEGDKGRAGGPGTGGGGDENGGGDRGTGGGAAGGSGSRGPGNDQRHKTTTFSEALHDPAAEPAALKEQVLETAEKMPLLRFLNRIPDKNGRRWIVLPFSFTEGGREYGISLRIMLEGNHCRMTLDMAEGPQDGDLSRRRLFVMERPPGEVPALSVSLWPGRRETELHSLKKELEVHLGLPQDHIQIKNADNKMDFSGFFPQSNLLPSVNEEV
jgi:hypothetical protein